MKKLLATITVLAAMAGPSAVADSLLWDNYPGGAEALDTTDNISSERDTQVGPSVAADDVVLPDDQYLITRFEWVGVRAPGFDYVAADLLIYDTSLNPIATLSNLPYSATPVMPDPNPRPDRETYEGSIDLLGIGEAFNAPSDEFFVGVRLVGDSSGVESRNFTVISSRGDVVRGGSEAFFLGPIFGSFNFTPAGDAFGSPDDRLELAFRVYGERIPEPASLALLSLGGLALLRRR